MYLIASVPSEQYAVQELTKAAMSGVGIDGEVLSYLELAQVCNLAYHLLNALDHFLQY